MAREDARAATVWLRNAKAREAAAARAAHKAAMEAVVARAAQTTRLAAVEAQAAAVAAAQRRLEVEEVREEEEATREMA